MKPIVHNSPQSIVTGALLMGQPYNRLLVEFPVILDGFIGAVITTRRDYIGVEALAITK